MTCIRCGVTTRTNPCLDCVEADPFACELITGRTPTPRRIIDGITHNRSGYNWHGCRCDTCTEAAAEYKRRRRLTEDFTHGYSNYNKRGCRCDECTTSAAEYRRRRRRRHGTWHAYNRLKCRCQTCRDGHAERARQQRAKRNAGRLNAAEQLAADLEGVLKRLLGEAA